MHIIGASGHAKVIIDTLVLNKQDILGIWDDNEDLKVLDFAVNGNVSAFKNQIGQKVVIAIGNNKTRKLIAEQLYAEFGIVVHPSSVISSSAVLSEGTVVMPNVTVNSLAKIGKHVILNTNSSVDHDCRIGDFVHISPQAGLAGNVDVGEGTHIGIGACIIQGVKIGRWVTIGAGAVIIRDVPDFAVVVGNPGKIIKYNQI
ncbi:acetyltransferase [Pedobacter nutrimenti]|uniref:acetyltransferase n=1 Tax=Pedobacter nutrimenti TaxID=1241337 RepID=UPI002931C241|nr:acetyltransferase [Pedobacter nutrimenti]